MTGWEFAKYLVDMMYSHWATTIVFMFLIGFIRPFAGFITMGIVKKKGKKESSSNPLQL